jgi:cell division protein ZapA
MSSRTDTEVIIGGKVFTLCGYESEEYLQKVASYINNKINEYSKMDSFRRQPLDMQSVLLQLNVADDYFKAKKQIDLVEEDIQSREKELYDLKHELISNQIKLESAQKQIKELQNALNESNKKVIRLETKLSDVTGDFTSEEQKGEEKKAGNGKGGKNNNRGTDRNPDGRYKASESRKGNYPDANVVESKKGSYPNTKSDDSKNDIHSEVNNTEASVTA